MKRKDELVERRKKRQEEILKQKYQWLNYINRIIDVCPVFSDFDKRQFSDVLFGTAMQIWDDYPEESKT